MRFMAIKKGLLAIAISLLTISIFTSIHEVAANEDDIMVGAYYYIWWGIPFNPHWNESIKYTPFLGKYNSSDPLTAERHIIWAKQHGIDFFAISWMGEGRWLNWDFDDIDYNLKVFLSAKHLENFNFCIFYETVIVLNTSLNEGKNFTEIFINDMTYAAENYFVHPSYLKINRKPVVFIYNIPYLYNRLGTEKAQSLLGWLKSEFDIYLVGDVGEGPSPESLSSDWLYALDAVTNYFFSNPSRGWHQILEDAKNYYPLWHSSMNPNGIRFIPNVYPGFNNTGLRNVSNPVVLPANASAFREMLNIAMNNTDKELKMLMITSWNEWLDGTAIEPSLEFGETFLHIILEIVPELPSITTLLFVISITIAIAYYKVNIKKIFRSWRARRDLNPRPPG